MEIYAIDKSLIGLLPIFKNRCKVVFRFQIEKKICFKKTYVLFAKIANIIYRHKPSLNVSLFTSIQL